MLDTIEKVDKIVIKTTLVGGKKADLILQPHDGKAFIEGMSSMVKEDGYGHILASTKCDGLVDVLITTKVKGELFSIVKK